MTILPWKLEYYSIQNEVLIILALNGMLLTYERNENCRLSEARLGLGKEKTWICPKLFLVISFIIWNESTLKIINLMSL